MERFQVVATEALWLAVRIRGHADREKSQDHLGSVSRKDKVSICEQECPESINCPRSGKHKVSERTPYAFLITRNGHEEEWRARRDSNPRPMASEG